MRLAWWIRALRLIRGTGVPPINRITLINHVIQRINPTKATNSTHGCRCRPNYYSIALYPVFTGYQVAGSGGSGWKS